MPVYLVVVQDIHHMSWGIYRILKVIETTLEAVQSGKHWEELREYQTGSTVTYLFVREPNNPFRDMV